MKTKGTYTACVCANSGSSQVDKTCSGNVSKVSWAASWENLLFAYIENKGTDQLHLAADQRLCFRCIDSMIPLLPKSEISNL